MPNLSRADKIYLRIAMPAAAEGVFMILLGAVDLIMVGSLGTAAIAAVSIFTQPRMMLLCVARSMAAAVTLLTAQMLGERHPIGDMVKQSLTLSFIVFVILHMIFWRYLPDLLRFMGAEEVYMPEAMLYGETATLGVLFTAFTTIAQAVMIGHGRTAQVLRINIIGNIINIVVNAVLIFGVYPFPALGVLGAAIGTVLGASYTTICSVLYLRGAGLLGAGSFLPNGEFLRRFLPVFGGVFCEQGFERIGMVLYTRMTAELGTLPYAVHAVCMNFCDFYYCFAGGLGKASMVMSGRAWGRGNIKDWRRYLASGIRWSLIFSVLSFVVTFFWRDEILSLYTKDAMAIALGSGVMIFVAAVSFPEAHAMICAGVLRGSGKTTQVAVYSFVSITLLRPIITALLLYHFQLGLTGAWLALAIDQTIRALCSSLLVWRIGAQ